MVCWKRKCKYCGKYFLPEHLNRVVCPVCCEKYELKKNKKKMGKKNDDDNL